MATKKSYVPSAATKMEAGEIKAEFFDLMHDAEVKGEEVVVIKNGQPVARFSPTFSKPGHKRQPLEYGSLRGKARVLGDVVGPMPVEWLGDHSCDCGGQDLD